MHGVFMKAQSLSDEPEEDVCLSHNKGDGHMIPRPDLHAHGPRDAGTYVCCQRNSEAYVDDKRKTVENSGKRR